MPGKIFIGTSGWNYPHWRAPFYRGAAASKYLPLYAQRFHSVEVNKSFYRLLRPPETKQWYKQTPDGFLFSLKGSRFITHILRLSKPRRALRRFFSALKFLKEKRGPILFQLPPRWHKNTERLKAFLEALPEDQRCAFELRDPEWIADDTLNLLRDYRRAFCIYDFDGRSTPRYVTTTFAYVRLHGPGPRYRNRYSMEQLRDWAKWVRAQLRRGIDVYFYFDNDQKAYAVKNAIELMKLLRETARAETKTTNVTDV